MKQQTARMNELICLWIDSFALLVVWWWYICNSSTPSHLFSLCNFWNLLYFELLCPAGMNNNCFRTNKCTVLRTTYSIHIDYIGLLHTISYYYVGCNPFIPSWHYKIDIYYIQNNRIYWRIRSRRTWWLIF